MESVIKGAVGGLGKFVSLVIICIMERESKAIVESEG